MKVWLKLWEWIRRYGISEVLGTAGAVGGAYLMFDWTHNEIVAAYAGAMGENVGFYGVMLLREWRDDVRRAAASGQSYGVGAAMRTARNLLLEFGPAELLDTGFIRPLAMGVGARYLDRELGVLAGKLVGDFFFYIPVIISYEARRWLTRRADYASNSASAGLGSLPEA